MKHPLPALVIIFACCVLAHGQSIARHRGDNAHLIEDATADQVVASRALLLLKRLDDDVIVYGSLEEFEGSRKLARVSFEDFELDLNEVQTEIEELAARLPDGRLKVEIRNALGAYRGGAYWWEKVFRPREINVPELRPSEIDATSDLFFRSSLLYTVVVHWQQAKKHLQSAIQHFK